MGRKSQKVVGNLQPILAQVPTFIEKAVMSADPEEEDVLMSEFDSVLETGDWTKGGEGRQPAKKLTAVKSMDTVNKH